ncbi:unnamed protein product [Thlaspi arvense]|uniref:Deubiquitinating enzyme MINDY-3/4 conserved domain-containing protein n=1 Tax=Thlaspi arvense TaxID=13288 RepID=A0AAU9R7Q6_THLAR|nr:unnamed protein product [Thlaspi arvense]
MADHQEDEDLKLALKMSMQHNPPEPKRSKPIEETGSGSQFGGSSGESPEAKSRRLQREIMAAAAEKRMMVFPKSPPAQAKPRALASPITVGEEPVKFDKELGSGDGDGVGVDSSGKKLSPEDSAQLFTMVFGNDVSRSILAQWTNQGIRFSPDPETTIGLVQHEGGPCGVLAALQAYVLKYLLYFPDDIDKSSENRYVASDSFSSVLEEAKTRALVRSMCEILFMCGNNNRAVIASFSNPDDSITNQKEEAMGGRLPIESASDLQKILRFETFTSQSNALNKLEGAITSFQSGMGALLFLISALLSRGLDTVQTDRDDPDLPLVTAPFGHASQEIVNLLLCGEAVPNVFDGRMDLGGGMFLKGISKNVEVGFLTLLESLNFCKVGQNLKCPRWPIWVIGSESHYTVLFALDPSVQEENELELRESQIRRAFDARDQSGGGGFISVEAFHQVVQETNIRLPTEKMNDISATGFIVWSELWQVILELDRNLGGIKDSTGMMGKKVFDIFHFNGIAKSDLNGGGQAMAVEGGTMVPMQRPRLTKLNVSVPPKWTPEEYMSCAMPSSSSGKDSEVNQPKPVQHAPLVDCIRTRWSRAACSWTGDPPTVVVGKPRSLALLQVRWNPCSYFASHTRPSNPPDLRSVVYSSSNLKSSSESGMVSSMFFSNSFGVFLGFPLTFCSYQLCSDLQWRSWFSFARMLPLKSIGSMILLFELTQFRYPCLGFVYLIVKLCLLHYEASLHLSCFSFIKLLEVMIFYNLLYHLFSLCLEIYYHI